MLFTDGSGRAARPTRRAMASFLLAIAGQPALLPATGLRAETQPLGETALVRHESVRLLGARGATYDLHLRTPQSAARPLPAIFVLAGFETGRAVLDLIDERDDLVIASMDYPFDGPADPGALGSLCAIPALRRMGFETLAAGSLALDHLARHAAVDPERIVLLGVSLGTVFITALGARDERPRAVVLIYGGGDLPALARNVLHRRGSWLPAWVIRPGTRAFFGRFEPLEHVARLAPRYLLMISSRADELFTPPMATALYERAREPKRLIWYDTGHMDLFDPVLIRRLTREVLVELRRTGHLPAAQ
jgi:fermentation-respiration switch protein FrsA (DUF1100 family)